MTPEADFDSALVHCDAAYMLETLSIGIAMLDAQLCLMYANPSAIRLLSICAENARGRPFAGLFQDSMGLASCLRSALEFHEERALSRVRLRLLGEPATIELRLFDLEVRPLGGFCTGTHLLLEFGACDEAASVARAATTQEAF